MAFDKYIETMKKSGRRDKEKSIEAANNLGDYGDSSVIPALEDAAKSHKFDETKSAAKKAINKIKSREQGSSDSWDTTETSWTDSSEDDHQVEITEATEVSQASEDALLLSLEETQTGVITRAGDPVVDEDSQKVNLDAKGAFVVKNTGEIDRIWDIDIALKEKGVSNLEDTYHINELDPQEEERIEYEIEELPDGNTLPLKFKEVIDTFPDTEDATSVLVYNQAMSTILRYEFEAEKDLEEIELTKEIPDFFADLTITDKSNCQGEVSIDGSSLKWNIPSLKAGEKGEVSLSCTITVDNKEPKNTGSANIKFHSKVEGAFSGVDIDGADGLVQNFSYIESEEIDDDPDNWKCRLVLKNSSEFPIELREVWVRQGEEYYFMLDQAVQIVESNKEWESPEWHIYSETIPSFEKKVIFTVKPEILYKSQSELEVQEDEMRVAFLEASKSYGIEEVPSFRESEIPTTINVSNVGSLGFKSLTIKDQVPPKFRPADAERMKVFINDEEIDASEYEITYEPEYSGDYETPEGEKPEPEPERVMNLVINRGEDVNIEPDDVIRVEYTPKVILPEPEDTFTGTSEISAELAEPGPNLEVMVEDDIGTIAVQHLRKAVRIGKTVIPAGEAGHYEVHISFENRGTAELSDIVIRDLIPEGFELISDSLEDLHDNDDSVELGTVRSWRFEKIEAGVEQKITYILKGTSDDFYLRNAQLSYS